MCVEVPDFLAAGRLIMLSNRNAVTAIRVPNGNSHLFHDLIKLGNNIFCDIVDILKVLSWDN